MRNLLIDGLLRIELTDQQIMTGCALNLIEYCDNCHAYHVEDSADRSELWEILDLEDQDHDETVIDQLKNLLSQLQSDEIEFKNLPPGIQQKLNDLLEKKDSIESVVKFKGGFAFVGKDGVDSNDFIKIIELAKKSGGLYIDPRELFDIGEEKTLTFDEAMELVKKLLDEPSNEAAFLVLMIAGILNLLDRPLPIVMDLIKSKNPTLSSDKVEVIKEIYQSLKKWKEIMK